jgi:hypothetical protein
VLYAISASWPGPGLAWPDLAWPDLAWLYFFFGVPFMVPFVSPPFPFPLPLEFGARASLSSWQTFLLVLGPSQSLFFIISESENQPWMIKVYDSLTYQSYRRYYATQIIQRFHFNYVMLHTIYFIMYFNYIVMHIISVTLYVILFSLTCAL